MVKKIMVVIKKIILGLIILYGYNLIAVKFNMTIPMNFITISLVSFLGCPALFALVLLLVIAF